MKRNFLLSFASLLFPSLLSSNPLISREELFAPSACMAIKISPDGKRLAYVGADKKGAMNLFVSSNLTIDEAECLTDFEEPEINGFYWSANSQKILLLKDLGGTRQYHLYSLDLKTEQLQNLTAQYGNVNAKVFVMSDKENKAVIGINHRNPHLHDLYLLDLEKGTFSLLFENEECVHFLFDEHLQMVTKLRLNADSSMTLFDTKDEILFSISAEDAFHTELLKYNSQEKAIYLLDNRNCNTTQLKKIYLEGKEIVLGHDPLSDIHEVVFEENHPVAYATYYTLKAWHFLNEKIKTDLSFIISQIGNNFSIESRSSDGKFWIVKNDIPEKGIEFLLYDRAAQKLSSLLPDSLDDGAAMYPLLIPSKDGRTLVSYLTLPKESDNNGKPKHPLPLVIIPHGGPFKIRDYYEYSPYNHWLANRGYAVLSVNFRLSSGFGKEFVNAGNGEWGNAAHQDILDAIKWCIDSRIAQEGKIAIFGGSYGGYEALCGLTFSPKDFACAIAICAPSKLKTVLEKTPLYWEFPRRDIADRNVFFTRNAFFKSMGGDPNKESDLPFLDKCSPLNYVSAIEKPLLLVHGSNDPIVAASESDQIFESLKQNGCPALYLTFSDEGHGVTKSANNLCYLAYSEWLFSKVLGGRFEPLQEEILEESNLKIQSVELNPESVFH